VVLALVVCKVFKVLLLVLKGFKVIKVHKVQLV